jgi:hypothetical protein
MRTFEEFLLGTHLIERLTLGMGRHAARSSKILCYKMFLFRADADRLPRGTSMCRPPRDATALGGVAEFGLCRR